MSVQIAGYLLVWNGWENHQLVGFYQTIEEARARIKADDIPEEYQGDTMTIYGLVFGETWIDGQINPQWIIEVHLFDQFKKAYQ